MARRLLLDSTAPEKTPIEVPTHKAPEEDVQHFLLHFEPQDVIRLCVAACEAMLPHWNSWIDKEISISPDTPPGKNRSERYEKARKGPSECLRIIADYLEGKVPLAKLDEAGEGISALGRIPSTQANRKFPASSIGWLIYALQAFEREERSIKGYAYAENCIHYGEYFCVPFPELERIWRDKGLL